MQYADNSQLTARPSRRTLGEMRSAFEAVSRTFTGFYAYAFTR